MRSYAGAFSSADERAGEGNAVERDASPKTARGAETSSPASPPHALGAVAAVAGIAASGTPRLLAAAFLRFQCVEQKKEDRETQLHAQESGQARTGRVPRRLAVEQLLVLYGTRKQDSV